MRTEAECLVKADELHWVAMGNPVGWDRTHYLMMEANWRRLAKAAAAEALRIAH